MDVFALFVSPKMYNRSKRGFPSALNAVDKFTSLYVALGILVGSFIPSIPVLIPELAALVAKIQANSGSADSIGDILIHFVAGDI